MWLIHRDDPLLPIPAVQYHNNMKRSRPVDQEKKLLQDIRLQRGFFDDIGRLERQVEFGERTVDQP